jgi:hypothetical protein
VEEGPHDRTNQPAFGSQEWFDAVYPPLLGYHRSFAARWADDAASVALLRFHEKGPHGTPLGVQIGWLRVTGHHWIVSQLRSPRGREASERPPDRVGSDASGDELRDVVRDGLARFLRRLRRRLPKELDEVIRLRFDSAMTLRQIADQLLGEGATDARLYHEQNPPLDASAKARWRKQALEWLKADLAAQAKILQDGPPAARRSTQPTIQHWQADPDLAGIRDESELKRLPEDEQRAYHALWAEVAALLANARTGASP